jgi:two-component system, NarL family, nitrate/nitrite response regulator NarL
MCVMDPIRIVLVDDHVVIRAGLKMVIESSNTMVVVAEASNGVEAVAAVGAHKPDVVLLDLDLDGEHGLDLIPDLMASAPDIQVLVLTGVRDPETHRRAVMRGAMGLVLKDRAVATLLKAIEKVYAGEIWFDRSLIADVLRDRVRSEARAPSPEETQIATLTARERDVIALIVEGLRNREIAARLAISEATVRHHLTSIFSKLGVADRTELVIYAYRNRLVLQAA